MKISKSENENKNKNKSESEGGSKSKGSRGFLKKEEEGWRVGNGPLTEMTRRMTPKKYAALLSARMSDS